jgi:YD repeat-containing protein
MLPEPLRVRRVLGDGPFAETGLPRSVAISERRGLIAVGGSIGSLQWEGAMAHDAVWKAYRIGIYRREDMRCRCVVDSAWPVNSMDFHPELPLLAIGTGCYDGGASFNGELLLLDLHSGKAVSALEPRYEVRSVKWRTWRDGRVLDLALAPAGDDELGREAHSVGYDAMVEREDWSAVGPHEIGFGELYGPMRPNLPPGRAEDARKALRRLSAAAGTAWSPRGAVWAVEQLPDGRVLAALDGVRLESWGARGAREWAVPDQATEGGKQIHLAAARDSAWVTVPGRKRWTGSWWSQLPWHVVRFSLRDGKLLDTLDVPFPGTLSARSDGRLALRGVGTVRRGDSAEAVFYSPGPEHREEGRVSLGLFSAAFQSFPLRRASAFYFLQGADDPLLFNASSLDTWVVGVEPATGGQPAVVRRLFRFPWDPALSGPLYSGPGVEVADAGGRALVHSAALPERSGEGFVVRRRLPDGSASWVFPTEGRVTAMEWDGAGATVFVTDTSGGLVALDAASGRARWRERLRVAGRPTVGLSLASSGPGRLVIGTVDGRVLDCVTAPGL